MKKAIVLINVGTPDSPETKHVRPYLREFLGDKHVIDIPALPRWLLVNLIIAPFRAPKSAKLYQQLWTSEGSPLLYLTQNLAKKIQDKLNDQEQVFVAMRYGNPSIKAVLNQLQLVQPEEIVIVPMYPHYAESTTGTVVAEVMKYLQQWTIIPAIKVVGQFYNHPAYIQSFTRRISAYQPKEFDHILFSYHGLPESHIHRIHPDKKISACHCENQMPAEGNFCYRATCYATSRLLQEAIDIPQSSCSQAFQSRLTKKWLRPFADEKVIRLAQKGVKKLLVVAPAFVTDCLETLVEIGHEYEILFKENGGEKLVMVSSLNDEDYWANALLSIIKQQ